MTDNPVHRDDITALKADGDLKAYMRSLIQPTKSTTPAPRKRRPRWGSIPIPPDHKPGAWPAGTQPPGPAPDRNRPAADWDDAITRYRTETRAELDEQEDNQ
ncbi:hypothetical protein ABT215_11180 [Streptomyces sp900105755]|uniref:hypothetical protein n=1 Tax=Streptomyces sp. 900105755 TaxID=3154389 RepID=UPI00332DEF50